MTQSLAASLPARSAESSAQHGPVLAQSDPSPSARRCGTTRRSCVRKLCLCCLSVMPNRVEASRHRSAPRQLPFPKRATRQRCRGTSTCGYPHPTLSRRWTVIACKGRVPFKNEHRRSSFVISPNQGNNALPHSLWLTFLFRMTGTLSLCAQHRGFQLTTRCRETE
jgi:hypothetical protein